MYNDRKNKKILLGGINETIATTEVTKASLNPEDKHKIFGDDGVADKIQSESTKGLIKLGKNGGLDMKRL